MTFWKIAKIAPIQTWPGRMTAENKRTRSPLTSDVTGTIKLLQKELEHLGASRIVLSMALTDPRDNLRKDGGLRADARLHHPGVILSFRTVETEVFMKAFDGFRTWQENLRALAVNLQHLRMAGLHGAEPRRLQYASWRVEDAQGRSRQDPPRPQSQAQPQSGAAFDPEDIAAAQLIERITNVNAQLLLRDVTVFKRAAINARGRTHPDMQKDAAAQEAFQRVHEALLRLERMHGLK